MRHLFRYAGAALASLAVFAASPIAAAGGEPSNQATVVMVHGAWADTSSWNGELSALASRGILARAIANPLRGLNSDSESVTSFLRSIDGPVVLVGHSYGGAVISAAAAGSSNVKGLVYVDAFIPDVGESARDLNGATSVIHTLPEDQLFDPVPQAGAADGAVDLLLKKAAFQQYFASDLPADQSARLWATQRATSTAAVGSPSSVTAWKSLPSWAFVSTGDQIITAESKLRMAQRAGSHVTTFEGGSHLSLVSQPAAVVSVIESALATFD